MARKNPTIDKSNVGLPTVMDGIDNLPNPAGTNQTALSKANAMPDVSMKTNNGDNPSIGDAPFANGKDNRNRTSMGPKSDPTPAMPGANV